VDGAAKVSPEDLAAAGPVIECTPSAGLTLGGFGKQPVVQCCHAVCWCGHALTAPQPQQQDQISGACIAASTAAAGPKCVAQLCTPECSARACRYIHLPTPAPQPVRQQLLSTIHRAGCTRPALPTSTCPAHLPCPPHLACISCYGAPAQCDVALEEHAPPHSGTE
jgi:hypothetical protein